MELIELETEKQLEREAAAEWLRELADQLSRHNKLQFSEDGRRYTIDVPKQVTMEVEFEIEDGESSLEIELKW